MYGFPWQGMGIRSIHHIPIPCFKHCTQVTSLCLVLYFAIERDINEEPGIYKEYLGCV